MRKPAAIKSRRVVFYTSQKTLERNDPKASLAMQWVNETDRSFAPLRMTTTRNGVILSEAKDLYAV